MPPQLKKALVLLAGAIFIVLGLLGMALPFLQGFFFLTIGVVLLSFASARIRTWLETHTRRHPRLHKVVTRMQKWMLRIVGPIDYKPENLVEHKKAADVMVFNAAGMLALQKRSAHDDSYPSHWDFSAGGGIEEGEDERACAEREVREELGITVPVEFVKRTTYSYPAWKPGVSREVDAWLYRAKHEGPFMPDTHEVERVEFFSLDQIRKMMRAGEKFHPEFLLTWDDGLVRDSTQPKL